MIEYNNKTKKKMVSKIICLAVIFCALLSLSQSQGDSSFGEWKSVHGKKYVDQAEEHYRAYIFNKNVKAIKSHNSDTTKTFKQAINKFADKTAEELKYTFLNLLPSS
jgi:ABC-type sugar transport system substrate-binding protein